MENHLFKKIEIWVLYLVIVLGIVLSIFVGTLVRQELVGTVKAGFISKAALFLAEIPVELTRLSGNDFSVNEEQGEGFSTIYGFKGEPLEDEVYLLHSRYDGNLKRSVVELVDLRSFTVRKTWSPDIDQINGLVDTSNPEFLHLRRDKNSRRYTIIHPFLTEDGGLIFQSTSPLVKIDKSSQLVWQNQENVFHHTIEQDHEGNFWVPSQKYPYYIDKKYVGSEHGKQAWCCGISNFNDHTITKVSSSGNILFEKSVSQILMENNMEYLLFQMGIEKFNNDPIHLNDIEPALTDSNYWKRGDIFLSLRHQSMIILYRPSTNQIIWKGVGHTYSQHDIDILDDHRISIFNNNAKHFFDGEQVDGTSNVLIYDFKTDTYSKYLEESLKNNNVRTLTQGRSQILGNGDLFIEEQNYGRTLYFNKDKSLKWQHVNRADDGKIYTLNWSRILYKREDIIKVQQVLKAEINLTSN